MIELYPHNQIAYDKVVAAFERWDRCCIVAPTGTGKSFVGAKLAQDNPTKRFLWLSPSDYIAGEQAVNLRRADPEFDLSHIEFMTYAMAMARARRGEECGRYDFVVVDEFHHVLAPEWKKGIAWVLDANPHAKVLGMSATQIRYSDGNRDVAEEFFEGHIASNLDLATCWQGRILPRPTYICCKYDLAEDLEDYAGRVRAVEDGKKRTKAEDAYGKMRRAVAGAEGLDEIFAKYCLKKDAKFLVFCRNVAHIDDVAEVSPQWFSRVNHEVRIYRVHHSNPSGDKELEAFKADDSDGIKLALCVDQLNEGVHIEGIDGVIMARPSSSPTIFQQQLGRALDAASNKVPLVFDLVDNIGNLGLAEYGTSAPSDARGDFDLDPGEDSPLFGMRGLTVVDELRDLRSVASDLEDALKRGMTFDQRIKFLEEIAALNGGKLPSGNEWAGLEEKLGYTKD